MAIINETAKEKYGCALLAGGRGTRLGTVNKAQLCVCPAGNDAEKETAGGAVGKACTDSSAGTETFLQRTTRLLTDTGMPCYLSVAAYEQPVPEGWTAVEDAARTAEGGLAGPMAGIFSCLVKAKEDGLGGLFFVPCDAPAFELDVIEEMLPHTDGADLVVWQTADGRRQMTFAYYAVSSLPAIKEQLAAGRYRLRDLAQDDLCRTVILDTEAEGLPEERFQNINLEEDRTRL